MKLSLSALFFWSVVGAAIAVAGGAAFIVTSSERSATAAAYQGREAIALQVQHAADDELGRATRALAHVKHGLRGGAILLDDDSDLEAALFLELLADDHLAQVTVTRANHAQIAVYHARDGSILTRRTVPAAGGVETFTSQTRVHDDADDLRRHPFGAPAAAQDPGADPTFTVPAEPQNLDRVVWSDLHFSDHDAALPPARRRPLLTVQSAVTDGAGSLRGVVRVGLLTDALDQLALKKPFLLGAVDDPHAIALLAIADTDRDRVELVAKVTLDDQPGLVGGEVRIVSPAPPPSIRALLASDLVRHLDHEHPDRDGAIDVDGHRWLVTHREIHATSGGTSGWLVAVLGPAAYYERPVWTLASRLAAAYIVTIALVLGLGLIAVRVVRRGLARVVQRTASMREFDFAPGDSASGFREVEDVLVGLERAKTVVRALGKYIPLALVRDLYDANEEPALGAAPTELTVLFTDIEGFTSLAEKLPPDLLAARLGDYLDVMTTTIAAADGTIDKFIGDAVMAFWNAPRAVPGHAEHACRAILACRQALSELYRSEPWRDLPPLQTRYGMHTTRAMVGHFGARARFNYTAVGDGVNLAARLEPLCKQYGVTMLVSEDVVREAGEAFFFRRIDRCAVKGKSIAIEIHELRGLAADATAEDRALVATYERGLDAFVQRDFAGAIAALEPLAANDPPSAHLAERARAYLAEPPADSWDGTRILTSK